MKQKRTLSILLVLTLLITCAPWTAAAAASTEESVGTEATTPTTEQPVVEETQLPLLEADTVPETMEYADAVAQDHILRLYGEEGNDLNRVVFLNRDGSRTMYLYDFPVKYVDSDGIIRDISLDIADSNTPLSKYETAANSTVTSFSEKLSDGISLTGNGVSIRLVPVQPAPQPGQSLTATADAIAQRIDSKTVEYRYDAKTTIEYSLTYTGFKEDIVVSEYTGQTEYHFFLYTGGLSLTQLDGSYFLTDEDGAIKASIGDIIVFTADERNNTFGQLEAEPIKDQEIYLLSIVLDAEYLSDPDTAYPIRIDPTVQINYGSSGTDAIEDVTIYSNGQSDHTAEMLHIGLRSTEGIARVLMKFPGLDLEDLGQGLEIVNANVQLYEVVMSEVPLTIYCHIFSGAVWDADTIHGPDIHPRMVGAYLDSLTMSYSNGLDLSTPHCYSFDITAAVQGWVDGTYVQERGILFKASAVIESGENELYKIVGSYNRSSCRPALSITYTAQSAGSAVPEFSLDKTVVDIGENSSFNLNVTNPSELTVSWSSSNEAVATVNNGTVTTLRVGTAVITATVTDEHGNSNEAHCIVYVKIANGVFYIQNMNSGLYLHVNNGNIDNNTQVTQFTRYGFSTDVPYKLHQMWKIYYLGNGFYSIRPMLKLDMALRVSNNYVCIGKIGTSDELNNVPSNARWIIEYTENGYIFKYGSHYAMQVANASTDVNANVMISTYSENSLNCNWDFATSSTGIATGVVLYDTSNGTNIAKWYSSQGEGEMSNPMRWLAPGETRTLSQLNIVAAAFSENSNDQEFYWYSESNCVSVNPETGAVTGVASYAPLAQIKGEIILDDGEKYTVAFSVRLTELAVGTYFIRNTETMRYVDIKNQSMSEGTIIHQWQFHGGYTQKWEFSHLGDGTYSIQSHNSSEGYYLGVNGDSTSSDASIVLRGSPDTPGTRWKVMQTSSGKYTLSACTSESDNLVMALDTGAFGLDYGDGVELQQLIYGWGYADEWYLCKQNGVHLEGQKWDQWCWAASARMVASYYMDPAISQEAAAVYVKSIHKVTSLTPSIEDQKKYNLVATPEQLAEAIGYYLGYTNYKEKIYYSSENIYDEETLRSLLDDGYPVVISRGSYDTNGNRKGGHFTVINGYSWNEDIQRFVYTIFDPMPVNQGEQYERTYGWIVGQNVAEGFENKDGNIWDGIVVYRMGNYEDDIPKQKV